MLRQSSFISSLTVQKPHILNYICTTGPLRPNTRLCCAITSSTPITVKLIDRVWTTLSSQYRLHNGNLIDNYGC